MTEKSFTSKTIYLKVFTEINTAFFFEINFNKNHKTNTSMCQLKQILKHFLFITEQEITLISI